MKLNNKGFAITLVLYGTLVLFLLLLVSLLGILSTYKLRLEKIYPEEVSLSCKISATAGYQNPQTLTIDASVSNVTYSWDNSTWDVNNKLENVKSAGTYTAYVKTSSGDVASCSIEIVSDYFYRVAWCDKEYSEWNGGNYTGVVDSECNGIPTYNNPPTDGTSTVYYWCDPTTVPCYQFGITDSTQCRRKWKRTRTCTSINCGSYGGWTTTYYSEICGRKVKSETRYGVEE